MVVVFAVYDALVEGKSLGCSWDAPVTVGDTDKGHYSEKWVYVSDN